MVVRKDGKTGKQAMYPSLRTPPSAYDRQVRYTVFEFEELLDSSSIDAKGWAEIAGTIYRNYQLFDAFVVLHGTDSLAYTCSALSFMLQNLGKPVILTGSQVPMLELQNDATDNLLGSLVIAGHFMIPEVCLFFNYKLFRGNRATKVSASDFDAFASPNHPPLAVINSMKTHVSWNLVYRPTHIDPFSIQTNLETSHVACLRIFPGIKPEMVEGVLQLDGLRGLVLETFGAGNAPSGTDSIMTKIIANAIQRGIVIVNVTQCTKSHPRHRPSEQPHSPLPLSFNPPKLFVRGGSLQLPADMAHRELGMSGTVSPRYAPANVLGQAGVVFGQDLTSEAALAKLSYLLALPGLTSDEVARQMSVSIRGELTEQVKTVFQHPHPAGTLTPKIANLAALGYAIARGDLDAVRELLKGEPGWLLNEADYSGNTPLVSRFRHLGRGDDLLGTSAPVCFPAIPANRHPRVVHPPPMSLIATDLVFVFFSRPSPAPSSDSRTAVADAGRRIGVGQRINPDHPLRIHPPPAPPRPICTLTCMRAVLQHLAATGPNLEILREFLTQGASVHLRNRAGRTPLFLAARAGLKDNVELLRQSGAHLHSSELGRAWLQSSTNAKIWGAAGLTTNGTAPVER